MISRICPGDFTGRGLAETRSAIVYRRGAADQSGASVTNMLTRIQPVKIAVLNLRS
jgi:hypothetical protein